MMIATAPRPSVRRAQRKLCSRSDSPMRVPPDQSSTVTAGAVMSLLYTVMPTRVPDVIVTDVVLPEMDGRDLAERIRALRPSIRVVFMSGYAPGLLTDRGVLAPGAAFLQKPFPIDQLARRLRQVLDTPAGSP